MVYLLATVELELLSESEVLGGLVDCRLEGGYLLSKVGRLRHHCCQGV